MSLTINYKVWLNKNSICHISRHWSLLMIYNRESLLYKKGFELSYEED